MFLGSFLYINIKAQFAPFFFSPQFHLSLLLFYSHSLFVCRSFHWRCTMVALMHHCTPIYVIVSKFFFLSIFGFFFILLLCFSATVSFIFFKFYLCVGSWEAFSYTTYNNVQYHTPLYTFHLSLFFGLAFVHLCLQFVCFLCFFTYVWIKFWEVFNHIACNYFVFLLSFYFVCCICILFVCTSFFRRHSNILLLLLLFASHGLSILCFINDLYSVGCWNLVRNSLKSKLINFQIH